MELGDEGTASVSSDVVSRKDRDRPATFTTLI